MVGSKRGNIERMTGECTDVGEVPASRSKVGEVVCRCGGPSVRAGVSARLSEGDGGNSMLDGDGEIARECSSTKYARGGSWMILCVNPVGEASVIDITTAALSIPLPSECGLTISNSGFEGGLPG